MAKFDHWDLELVDDLAVAQFAGELAFREGVREYLGASPRRSQETREVVRKKMENEARRTVLLLPGLFGSSLVDESGLFDELVWINPFELMLGKGIAKLSMNSSAPRLVAKRPLRFIYDPLIAELTLGARARVIPFGFDWRQGLDALALLLDRKIEELSGTAPDKKFTIVAHSMGAAVTWRYAQLFPQRAVSRIEQFIALAPAIHGSFDAASALFGDHIILQRMDYLAPQLVDQLGAALRTFPAFYDPSAMCTTRAAPLSSRRTSPSR